MAWSIFGWCFLAFGRMFHLPLVMAAVSIATAAVLINKDKARRRRRRMRMIRRRYWVHPIISNREQRGQFSVLYNDLRQHEEKFFNYSRMSVNRLVCERESLLLLPLFFMLLPSIFLRPHTPLLLATYVCVVFFYFLVLTNYWDYSFPVWSVRTPPSGTVLSQLKDCLLHYGKLYNFEM